MNAIVSRGVSDKGIPYAELKIFEGDDEAQDDGLLEITFRKYKWNVFVAVDDQRGNPSSGADLEDCWLAPTTIIEKTPIPIFDPLGAYIKALRYANLIPQVYDWDENNYWYTYYKEAYDDISGNVKEWQELSPNS